MARRRGYATNLEQWKRELSAELGRDVTSEEIAKETGLAYSTVIKHGGHVFLRPETDIAAKIVDFFNERSKKKKDRTTLDYFIEVDLGQPAAVA